MPHPWFPEGGNEPVQPVTGWWNTIPGVEAGNPGVGAVPLAFGRTRVRPVIIFNRNAYARSNGEDGSWQVYQHIDGDYYWMSAGSVDAVLAICQAGATIQGVWKGKEYVGLKLNAAGSWVQANSSTVMQAIRRLQAVQKFGGGAYNYPHGTGNYVTLPATLVPAGHELITSTSSPFGSRSTTTVDSYTSLTGSFPAWPYLAGSPAAGQGYLGLTHLRCERLALAESTGLLPSIEFLVDGIGGLNCHPVTAVRWVLENMLGIPSGDIVTDVGPDGRTVSSFQAYADAMTDVRINATITGSAKSVLDSLLQACNAEIVQSDGKVKVWPLGDSVVGSYVPSQFNTGTSAWEPVTLDQDEVGLDGIRVEITDDAGVYNRQAITYKDAMKQFEDTTYTFTDDWHAADAGRRPAGSINSPWVSTAKHAVLVAQTLVRGYINQRRKVVVALPSRWLALEPGDVVSIGDNISIPAIQARISLVEEQDDGSLEIEAWEWGSGASHPIDLTPEQPSEPVVMPAPTSAGDAMLVAISAGAASAASDETTSDNLYPNPTSEIAPPQGVDPALPAWANRYNAGVGVALAGAWVRRIVTVAGGGRYQEAAPVIIQCVPGERFYFEAMVSERTAGASTQGYIWARFYDSAGSVVSVSPDPIDIRHVGATTWTKFSVTTPAAPAGAVAVRFGYGVDCTAGVVVGETYWWEGLLAKRIVLAAALGDDQVSGAKLTESWLVRSDRRCGGISISSGPTYQWGWDNSSTYGILTGSRVSGYGGYVMRFAFDAPDGLFNLLVNGSSSGSTINVYMLQVKSASYSSGTWTIDIAVWNATTGALVDPATLVSLAPGWSVEWCVTSHTVRLVN